MKEEYYQIGDVSRITGISKDTLHFYTKIGLVTPDYINPKNHYHYYSRWNMYQLDIIATCRNLKIPLEQVADDISWYYEENERIKTQMSDCKVHIKHFGPETVIVGNQKRKESSYHANLQDVLI